MSNRLSTLRRLEAHALPDPWPEGGTWVKDMLNRCSEAEARQTCAFLAHTRNALLRLLDVAEAGEAMWAHLNAKETRSFEQFKEDEIAARHKLGAAVKRLREPADAD